MSWMMTVWWSTEWFICLPRCSPLWYTDSVCPADRQSTVR